MYKETKSLDCPDCPSQMYLIKGKFGWFYRCIRYPDCGGKHSVHQRTMQPMGTPANYVTRQARIRAHDVFDQVWQRFGLHRDEAYSLLQSLMHLHPDKCHISMFTAEQCEELVQKITKEFPEVKI